jgi:hypothetical protein
MLAAGAATVAAQAQTPRPIQLHLDLAVDSKKEKEMLRIFETSFKPAAAAQPGYIDVKMLKLRSAVLGKAPEGINYRFSLVFQSEELRQKWIATPIHQKVWPAMESTLSHKNYSVLLFDAY